MSWVTLYREASLNCIYIYRAGGLCSRSWLMLGIRNLHAVLAARRSFLTGERVAGGLWRAVESI